MTTTYETPAEMGDARLMDQIPNDVLAKHLSALLVSSPPDISTELYLYTAAAIRRLEARPEPVAWQPIETAPAAKLRDDEDSVQLLLLNDQGEVALGYVVEYDTGTIRTIVSGYSRNINWTHWFPVPGTSVAPPAPEADALRAENKRLREALSQIAEYPSKQPLSLNINENKWKAFRGKQMQHIAHTALTRGDGDA